MTGVFSLRTLKEAAPTLTLIALLVAVLPAGVSTLHAASATLIGSPPSAISVGDSETVNYTFKASLSQVTSTSPTVSIILTITGINQNHFRTSAISYDVLITHLGSAVANLSNATTLTYNATSSTLQLSTYYTGALPYTDVNLTITLHVPAAKVYNVSDAWNYRLVVGSGSQPYLLTDEGSSTISITPKPPSLSITSVEPSPLILAPGVFINVSAVSSDASNVSNVSLIMINASGSTVSKQVINVSAPTASVGFSVGTTGLPEGDYVLQIRSCDTLNICAVKELNVTLTRTFTVPSTYFRSIEDVLKHPGFTQGSRILVTGKVTEYSTVNVTIPNIVIAGNGTVESKASSVFALSGVRNVTVANITIKCNGTAFTLIKSTNVTISGVSVSGVRFIKVEAPVNTTTYWSNTIVKSTLNGKPVLYLVGGGIVSNATYSETHLLFGNYVLNNTALGNAYVVNSSITAYDSPATTLNLTYSNMSRYWTLTVKVLFAGSPVEGALVRVTNNVTSVTLTTNAEGVAKTYLLGEQYVNGVRTLVAGPTTVTASKLTFEANTTVTVNKTTTAVLNLPAPKCSMALTTLEGKQVSKALPGEVLKVTLNASISTVYTIKLEVVQDGNVVATITKQTGSRQNEFLISPGYGAGSIEVKAYIYIAGMPSIKLEPCKVGVSG